MQVEMRKIAEIKPYEMNARAHPTQKPVGLFVQILKDFPGEIVLDPYHGSGSTMVACQNAGRRCRGIEISADYVATCLQRMADAFPGISIKREEVQKARRGKA